MVINSLVMARKEIKFYAISNISQAIEKDALYAVKGELDSAFKLYVTDLDGNLIPLLANGSGGGIVDIISSDNSISITGTTIKNLTVSSTLQSIINTALQNGDNVSELINNAGYITLADIPTSTFDTDTPVILSSGKTLGKYVSGQTIPSAGKTFEEVIKDIALEYVNPAFTSFNISTQPTTVEVGTTLSGSKTFNWNITLNSGIVPTIDIYDNTIGTTLLSATLNDGTENQVINTIQLNSNGSTQSWKGIGNNSNGVNINSGNFIVTSLYNRYWGAVPTLPTNPIDGASNRTYANNLNVAFKTNGVNTFTLLTGTTENKFVVLLPPTITITSVIDTTNLSANITSDYTLSTIVIKDAGGTDRVYNQYTFNPSGTYPVSANHQITTN